MTIMENNRIKLHLEWRTEGISIKALTEILNHFDSLNSHLEQRNNLKDSGLVIKEVRKGSIEFILANTAINSIPAIYKLLKETYDCIKNNGKKPDYDGVIDIISNFISSCIENDVTFEIAVENELRRFSKEFLLELKSWIENMKNEN